MFIAASTGSYSDLDFDQACRQITDLGYDRIELTMEEGGPDLSPSQIATDPEKAVLRVREASRLSVCALNIVSDIDASLYPGLFKFAKLLKITQVTMPSLELGTPFNDETDRLKKLVAQATQEGIRLSLKTQIGRLTEDPHTAVELCQAVRGLWLALDPSHFACGPYRSQNYDMVYEYTSHVHLRDSTPDQLQVPVGLGEIDYNRVITQLKTFDYNRAFSVDLIPALADKESRDLEMRRLRMLIESLL